MTSSRLLSLLATFVCGISTHTIAADAVPSTSIEYNRDIRPILSDKCFRCHGPDSGTREASLRLDQRDAAIADRNGKQAIRPGEPERSEVLHRILSSNPDARMPPPDSGSELAPAEIDRLKRWIEQGAEYQPHWSFLPPRRPSRPEIRQQSWPRNAIDEFVLARLERDGFTPSSEADRFTWLRRVSLDLIGLPPTLEELDAFLADQTPQSYETVVDRLLESPHYGERMALDWLDGARYADTNGYFSDFERPVWRWRDWVIEAFNRNQPFDQFTIEQLAGDLLPNPTVEQRIATGFHRNHTTTDETGIIDEEYRVEYIADRLETTGAVWLGLTIGCARCHDHKYDPISQKEFYQLFAFFNQGPDTGLASQDLPPVLKLSTPEYEKEAAERKQHRAKYEQAWHAVAEQVKQNQIAWKAAAKDTLPLISRDDLVSEYLFEQDLSNGVADRPAAVAHEPTNFSSGVRGDCLKYENPFHAEFDPALTLDSEEPWSISFWTSVEGVSLACLLSKIEPTDDLRGLEILWVKGRVKVHLIHRRDENAIQIVTQKPVAANRWHHIAVTYDGSRRAAGLKVYLDGTPQDVRIDRDTLTDSIANARPWMLGRKDDGLGFIGRMDQLRFYHRVLSDAEIADALYAGEEISGILSVESAQRSAQQQDRLKEYFIQRSSPEVRQAWMDMLAAQRADVDWTAAQPKTLVMEDLPQRRDTFVLQRGQYDQPGEKVDAAVPAVFPPLSGDGPPNRLTLARWLVQPDHPLTSRVIVNRYWTLLFGEGLVKTANDFGSQGELPSHPELLDWLAIEFQESGWNLKALLKQIVLSAAYRQSSTIRPDIQAIDPENRLLARGPRFRLAGELLRDQALAVSGLLSHKIGGPSVKPYQPPGLWEAVSYDGNLTYVEDSGESLYRRSLYTFWKRQAPPPTMISFDSPTRETCAVKRPRTNTPLQALVLLNDPTFVEAARKLAENTMLQADSSSERIQLAVRRTTGRRPDAEEIQKLTSLFQQQLEHYRQQPRQADDVLSVGASVIDGKVDRPELAAWTIVCSLLLNLDEVITKP